MTDRTAEGPTGRPTRGRRRSTRPNLQVVDEKTTPKRQQTSIPELTEAYVSERLTKEVLKGKYCYNPALGWLHWDGRYWKDTPNEDVVEVARRQFKSWYHRPLVDALLDGSGRSKQKATAIRRLLSKAGVAAVVDLCKGQLLVDDDRFDADRHLLNTPTSVVDLRSGKLLPHDPELYMTKITTVGYERGAKHRDWDAALKAVRPDALEWLQYRIGNGLTGQTPDDDIVPFCRGGGENGKSTLFGGIAGMLGSYYRLISDKVLLGDHRSHTTELTDLRGLRTAVIEELPEGKHLDVVRLKKVTGQEITARKMRRDDMTFVLTHSLFVTSNYATNLGDTDWGTWRRVALLVFPYKFIKPGQKRRSRNERPGDPTLRDRVRRDPAVLRAALAWAVEGAIRWYANDRTMPPLPESVQADTDKWRGDSDFIFKYWNEWLVPDASRHIASREMAYEFNNWLTGDGHQAWSAQTLTNRFSAHELFEQHRLVGPKFTRPGKAGLSRPRAVSAELGFDPDEQSYRAYYGVRFRQPDE
jgi:putative DNA primase/helicase